MKCIFPLRTIQWQLSLSYILVIMVTLPMLLGVAVAMLTLSPHLSPSQQLVWILQKQTAPQVTHEVQRTHDLVALNKWALNFSGNPTNLGWNVVQTIGVMILDHNGKRIVPNQWQLIKPVDILFSRKEGQDIVHAAFANNQDQAVLTFTFNDGQTIAAVPLLDTQQHPIGVFGVAVRGLTENERVPANQAFSFFWSLLNSNQTYDATTLNDLLRLILLLILIMSIISVAFGMVTGRRITRRLQRITSTVHSWSQGQFQETIHDHSPDELGQLASDLNQMTQQVQVLLNTQQRLALLEERQRVARDLHDSVKQHTFAATLLIGAARKLLHKDLTTVQTYLNEAEELIGQTRQELTDIIEELRPLALIDTRLGAALREYVQRWSQRTSIVTAVHIQDMPSLPLIIEETFLRVTQEALSNIARHSHANHVEVQLSEEAEEWYLYIHDNGQGFNVAQTEAKGLGVSMMHERVEAHQGSLRICSPATGTLIEVHIPRLRSNLTKHSLENESVS